MSPRNLQLAGKDDLFTSFTSSVKALILLMYSKAYLCSGVSRLTDGTSWPVGVVPSVLYKLSLPGSTSLDPPTVVKASFVGSIFPCFSGDGSAVLDLGEILEIFSCSRKLAANLGSTLVKSIKVPISGDAPSENLTCCELDRGGSILSGSWAFP